MVVQWDRISAVVHFKKRMTQFGEVLCKSLVKFGVPTNLISPMQSVCRNQLMP